MEENLKKLYKHSVSLSNDGRCVLELTSFQPAIERLILKLDRNDYPIEILNEFTFPLIKNGCFDTLHFCNNYQESYGTTAEHLIAKLFDVPIVYLP